jgi:hypothetical protein
MPAALLIKVISSGYSKKILELLLSLSGNCCLNNLNPVLFFTVCIYQFCSNEKFINEIIPGCNGYFRHYYF